MTVTHEEIDASDADEARKAMMHQHLGDGLCPAILWHGPGHQSACFCEKQLPHDAHYTMYGAAQQHAVWFGLTATTGFFDEPPKISAALREQED